MTDGYYTYCDQFIRYTNVELLHCTLETHIILYVDYNQNIHLKINKKLNTVDLN